MEPHTLTDRARPAQARPRTKTALVFVAAVWIAMLALALLHIAYYGRNIPLAEDWLMVAPLTGNEADLGGWLWEQNNEHRVPFPRLVYLALLSLTADFRVGMVFNALVLGGLAAALIIAARRLRGRTSFADAFFPLVLLHLGHWENLVWSWQIQFVVSIALTCLLLLVMLTQPLPLASPAALTTAAAILLLPLSGANGLIVSLVLLPWVLYAAHLRWRAAEARRERWTAAVLAGAGLGSVLLILAYFAGYERAAWNPPSPGPIATLDTAAKFLALGFGPAAAKSWALFVLAAAFLAAVTGLLLVRACLTTRGPERSRALGLLCFLGAVLVLAGSVGWGRAGSVPLAGIPTRYSLMAAPLLLVVPFAWQLYGPRRLRVAVQWSMLLGMLALLPFNTRAGYGWRNWYVEGMSAVERDLAAQLPPATIAERHRAFLLHWNQTKLEAGIEMLREAGIGPFAGLRGPVGVADPRGVSR